MIKYRENIVIVLLGELFAIYVDDSLNIMFFVAALVSRMILKNSDRISSSKFRNPGLVMICDLIFDLAQRELSCEPQFGYCTSYVNTHYLFL
ncbi:hypothetical protein Syn8016DRAFT_1685 [Synechococcus sp. WH 8016]|nr:hypothetical protein Syn8016DRAFT_1685 [Synechococcus sp. WH 8016]